MPRQTIEQRVDRLGERVNALEHLPDRLDDLSTQVLQIRARMDTEFSAIRGELGAIRGGPRTPETPSLRALQQEIRGLGATLREEIRGNGDRMMAQVRVLHEDLVARISALGEARKRTRRRG